MRMGKTSEMIRSFYCLFVHKDFLTMCKIDES